MNLGAAGPLSTAALSANAFGAALGAAPGVEEHVSLSAAESAHDAEPLGEVTLPNDHTVHLAQAARRGGQILYFTSMIGIRPSHRFIIGNPPVIEIIVVDRLGSVIPGAPILHNHPIGVPCRFLRDDSGVVEPDNGPGDGLPELPSGYEVARSNKDRKFELPHPMPATRKQIPEFHMNLIENVVMSNGGVNGEREAVFFNQVMLSMDPCEERWSKVPADMLVVDSWLTVKIMIFIEKGGDFHLLREVRGVRRAWFQDKKKVVAGKEVISHLLQLFTAHKLKTDNLNNIKHLLELSYNSYLDKYM